MFGAYSGLIGVAALIAVAVVFSAKRGAIRPTVALRAFLAQVLIGLFVLKVPAGQAALEAVSNVALIVIGYTNAGVDMVFGALVPPEGEVSFFIAVLPILVFFSALMAVLYHLQVMQLIVKGGGWLLERAIGLRPLESLNAVANIFMGQAEAPLTLRPYLPRASKAQVFTIMVSGMASVSGTVLAAFVNMGIEANYLFAASFMAAPGGLLMAHLFFPDPAKPTDEPAIAEEPDAKAESSRQNGLMDGPDENNRYANVIMAAAAGAENGMILAAKIGAMLLAFVALIALGNGLVGWLGGFAGAPDLTIQRILGFVFAPVMWLVGVDWSEAVLTGGIFGEKVIANEFIAYASAAQILDELSPKTAVILSFSLCGFANLSSIAILLGGLGSLVPARRDDIALMGPRALAAASFSNLMSAALAGVIVSL